MLIAVHIKLENDRIMWKGYQAHGNSPFGHNNMFGVIPSVVAGLK